MDWLSRMNDIVNYFEANLGGEIEYSEAARRMNCSVFHMQRIFIIMSGTPVSEYIRRRRLDKAAFDLVNTDMKIIDIAAKYGYNSPTAFNRAFQAMHGMPPRQAREEGARLKAYPPISFSISIKGAVEMNYRIEKMDAFRVIGPKLTTTMKDGECYKEIPEFWGEVSASGAIPVLIPLNDSQPCGILGISATDTYSDDVVFNYYAAVASTQPAPEGMHEYEIPAATWAVFESVGPMPGAIQDLQKRIVTEWLPTSGYEYAKAPDIELYLEGDMQSSDYKCEVWLPVAKKG